MFVTDFPVHTSHTQTYTHTQHTHTHTHTHTHSHTSLVRKGLNYYCDNQEFSSSWASNGAIRVHLKRNDQKMH